jgi:hypothetical protein
MVLNNLFPGPETRGMFFTRSSAGHTHSLILMEYIDLRASQVVLYQISSFLMAQINLCGYVTYRKS